MHPRVGALIHQLLTHTSGLADDYAGFQAGRASLRTPADFVTRFGAAPLAFPPGTSARYSNSVSSCWRASSRSSR
jgi:CubicO group peptidase (beta-lactamase class C family)